MKEKGFMQFNATEMWYCGRVFWALGGGNNKTLWERYARREAMDGIGASGSGQVKTTGAGGCEYIALDAVPSDVTVTPCDSPCRYLHPAGQAWSVLALLLRWRPCLPLPPNNLNTGRRRPAATSRRRPLRTLRNHRTSKGNDGVYPAQNTDPAAGDSEGPPKTKRARVKSPDNTIQFHPEPQYVAPAYSLSHPWDISTRPVSHLPYTQLNPSTRSALSSHNVLDPPQNPSLILSRYNHEFYIPRSRHLDGTISVSSANPHLSLGIFPSTPPTRGSFRMRTSLTPQPAQPREVSEPPPLSSLAQKPVFVRPPPDSCERVSSQSSSSSTLGSLVESRRSTRSPMRQHSSLFFGSGSQTQAAESNSTDSDRHPPDLTKARRSSDMFRPRRSSQLLLMRDDRRASLGRKTSYGFLDTEEPKEKENKTKKPKVNETKPYAGEGGMKKDGDEETEVYRTEELADLDESKTEVSQPLPLPPPVGPSNWEKSVLSQPASSGSSLRVGRTKTSRTHLSRPVRPSRKFSAAFDDADEFMDDGEDEERQKERDELEEAARKLPAFEVPAGFTFAKEPNAKPPVEHDANAPEPPIAALPYSFGRPSIPSEPVVPLSAPKDAPAIVLQPKPIAGPPFEQRPVAETEKTVEPEKPAAAVPNFFASSKLLSQASPVSSLLPSAIPSFGVSSSTPLATPSTDSDATPKHVASTMFPATPGSASLPSFTPTSTPIKDAENPFWEGDMTGRVKPTPSRRYSVLTSGDSQPFSFGAKPGQVASGNADIAPTTSMFGSSIFGAAKKDEPITSSAFDTSKPPATGGFMFGGGAGTSAATVAAPQPEAQPKPIIGFGSTTGSAGTAAEPEAAKAPVFAFGQATSTPTADPAKPLNPFGAPAANPFASSAAPEAAQPAFGFGFGQQKEPAKPAPVSSSPFTFGSTPSAPMAADPGKPANPSPFSFGPPAASASASSAPFSFGSGAANADPKPATTEEACLHLERQLNDVQEFTMEESPTRDMQAETKPAEPRPTLGGAGGGFSFGNPSSSGSLFGGQAPAPQAPAPFSFGASSSSNPFAAPAPAENKPFGGGDFGRPATSTFSFGQNNASSSTIDPPRPSTAGSFLIWIICPSSGTGFSFGGGNTTNANPFAPQPSGGSTPSSPSTFNQPFSFGAPQQSTSFSFGGSQPVSPAPAASNLPQPTTPGGFGGGGFGAQPSSPFGGGGSAPSSGGVVHHRGPSCTCTRRECAQSLEETSTPEAVTSDIFVSFGAQNHMD
ncbi:hypothetical protein B0H14DRAFT_2650722 [Mycena olivaceomarginata]|nr:hypothetical protein B0H14DRAFT_2650722 [Mycena olivaceomarginata]